MVGSRGSPGATILGGRVQVLLLATIVCLSRQQVPGFRDGLGSIVVSPCVFGRGGIDVPIVYLISVRLSSSHLSNGCIRVLGGSTTMSSYWKLVHTDFRSTEDRCCRTASNMCLSVHRVRISVASRNEFRRSSEVLKIMEFPAGVSEMRLARFATLLPVAQPSITVPPCLDSGVCVRTETAARNSRPAVSQDMGVLVVTSWDG